MAEKLQNIDEKLLWEIERSKSSHFINFLSVFQLKFCKFVDVNRYSRLFWGKIVKKFVIKYLDN